MLASIILSFASRSPRSMRLASITSSSAVRRRVLAMPSSRSWRASSVGSGWGTSTAVEAVAVSFTRAKLRSGPKGGLKGAIPLAERDRAGCGDRLALAVAGQLEHGQERLLGHLDPAHLLHALLARLLLLEQLALAAHVAAVALGDHVLAHRLDGLPGDDLGADRGLDGHLELLAGDLLAQALGHGPARVVGLVAVDHHAQRVHLVARQQDVELHELALAHADQLVVERGVALRP